MLRIASIPPDPFNFQVGSLERKIYEQLCSRWGQVISRPLISAIVMDIFDMPEVKHFDEIEGQLQGSEDNEEALIEAMKSFKDELKVIHQQLHKQVYDLDSTIRDVESLATSAERKIEELEHIPTKKGANNGQSVLQEA